MGIEGSTGPLPMSAAMGEEVGGVSPQSGAVMAMARLSVADDVENEVSGLREHQCARFDKMFRRRS